VQNARLCVVVGWCGFYVKIHVISNGRDSRRNNGEFRTVTVIAALLRQAQTVKWLML
jgi:hypothetical protein